MTKTQTHAALNVAQRAISVVANGLSVIDKNDFLARSHTSTIQEAYLDRVTNVLEKLAWRPGLQSKVREISATGFFPYQIIFGNQLDFDQRPRSSFAPVTQVH